MLADTPEVFDVIVMPNLYGDILSDVAAQIAGSIGLAGSANIGEHVAMFEAIHGSAPRIAGQDIANPSGLLLAAVMMLVHTGQPGPAERVHNALLRTLEEGLHTQDIYSEKVSKQKIGTQQFADAVIERLGQIPRQFKAVQYRTSQPVVHATWKPRPPAVKALVGIDLFLDWRKGTPDELGAALAPVSCNGMTLSMITNRGVKVWPGGLPETFCTDHWRCRFMIDGEANATHRQVISLLEGVHAAGFDFIKTENLYTFDGEPGFSLGQGQ